MYPVNISKQAESDADEAAAWYDEQLEGLSKKFYDDLHQAIRKIQQYPALNPFYKNSKLIRKKNLHRFPYKIFYIFNKNEIFVLAIIHHKRSAKHIKRRLK